MKSLANKKLSLLDHSDSTSLKLSFQHFLLRSRTNLYPYYVLFIQCSFLCWFACLFVCLILGSLTMPEPFSEGFWGRSSNKIKPRKHLPTLPVCRTVCPVSQCPTGQCELLTLLGQAIRPCRRPDKLSPNVSAGHPFAPLDGHHHRHPRLCTNQCTKGARSVTIYCPCLPAPPTF